MNNSIGSYIKEIKSDLPAGLVVFLVALPLCLGIALASGAPLFSGIISGIIGGLIVGAFSGSHLSVSGPAAGLTVIILNAITDLGSFEALLLAVVFAGIIQIILGVVKAGIIGMYFPSSIIKGMLSAIGLILILKQIPHLFGVDVDEFGEMEFFQHNGENTFTQLLSTFELVNEGALIIGLVSLAIIILWDTKFIKSIPVLNQIPGALLAVVIGLLVNVFVFTENTNFYIESSHLVSLPIFNSINDLKGAITFPDFDEFLNYNVYVTAITLAIIASLETLLSLEAVDKLDPHKRRSPQNKELIAQGLGNVVSGLIGGLPVTAVIVRSTANLEAGAKTKMAAIYHGLFLFVAVLFIPKVLNYIPLSTLAAILLVVGFKLSKPALYKSMLQQGSQQFIPFIVTILAILFTDLLVGILIGLGVAVYYILQSNYQVPYYCHKHENTTTHTTTVKLSEHVSFLNKASLQIMLEQLPNNSKVIIDGSSSKQIDHDALEIIYEYLIIAKDKNIDVELVKIPPFIGGIAAH